jgi:hypothetical protein
MGAAAALLPVVEALAVRAGVAAVVVDGLPVVTGVAGGREESG